MTAHQAAERSGLKIDRIYQFCRNFDIKAKDGAIDISEEEFAILMARRLLKNQRKGNSNDSI